MMNVMGGYFQQNGATAHTAHATLNYLKQFFGDRIIRREFHGQLVHQILLLPSSLYLDTWRTVFKRRMENLVELM